VATVVDDARKKFLTTTRQGLNSLFSRLVFAFALGVTLRWETRRWNGLLIGLARAMWEFAGTTGRRSSGPKSLGSEHIRNGWETIGRLVGGDMVDM